MPEITVAASPIHPNAAWNVCAAVFAAVKPVARFFTQPTSAFAPEIILSEKTVVRSETIAISVVRKPPVHSTIVKMTDPKSTKAFFTLSQPSWSEIKASHCDCNALTFAVYVSIYFSCSVIV